MSLSSTEATGKFGRRDAEELTALLTDLRLIADRLAYSTVGSDDARDERLLEALGLLDLRMRSFVAVTGLWNRLGHPGVAREVAETFANPLAGDRLRAVGEALSAPPMTPADSATRLHESVVLLARALRSRARRRNGPLNVHDVRIGYAGLSLAATEAYEQWREVLEDGPSSSGDRESRRRTARRLLAALTVGVTVLGTLSRRLDGEELAGRVRVVWAEIVTEELGAREPGPREIAPRDISSVRTVPGPTAPADGGAVNGHGPDGVGADGVDGDAPGAAGGGAAGGGAAGNGAAGNGAAGGRGVTGEPGDDVSDRTPAAGLRLINPNRATP